MSSWMKTLQSGANKVGNEAAKLKLYAEISLLKGDIKSLKEAWGVRGRRRAMDADALTLAARR